MRRKSGFTLIEVMIVVAIVAILAAIALPSYSDYVKRARITEAVSTLSAHRVKMEQYFQDNRTYVGACLAGTIASAPAPTPNFAFDCGAPSGSTFTLTATAVAGSSLVPAQYTVTESNVRATTPPTGWSNQLCGWVLKKDGSC